MRAYRLALIAAIAIAASRMLAAAPVEEVLNVPGHADFLVVDRTTVWATNKGRVERWARRGKLAEVAMSEPCGAMAITFNSLWVADCKDRTLNRIDLKTARKVAAIPTGIANPDGELNVTAGAGSVWVASEDTGAIARVDPSNNKVIATVRVDPGSYYLAYGYGSLWAVSASSQSLQKIDPRTNTVVGHTALGRSPGFLVAGEGAVWVQEQGDGTVARIDPQTTKVSSRVKIGETLKYGDIDAGGGKVWLRTTTDQTFVVIDPKSMKVRARIGRQVGSGALRFTPTGIWTSAHDLRTLSWWSKPMKIGN